MNETPQATSRISWVIVEGDNIYDVSRVQESVWQVEDESPALENEPQIKAWYGETPPEDEGDEEWKLVLVNRWNPLADSFSVRLTDMGNGQAVDARIYGELRRMLADARAEGLSPLVCSSFRTMEKQRNLFENRVQRCLREGVPAPNAEQEAEKWVARPGTSEHHTGLAVDIVALSYQLLDEGQERTPEQQWLMEHCWEYGFILRYPGSKSAITGIHYEPWHYRYVGREAAEEIMKRGICLEEYLAEMQR